MDRKREIERKNEIVDGENMKMNGKKREIESLRKKVEKNEIPNLIQNYHREW